MPLRITPENDRPAEYVAATRPPAEEIEHRAFRTSQSHEQRSERGTLILKLVISGIFVYVAAMGVGLLGMMFPHQQHDLVRAIKQAVAFVRPEPERPRVIITQQPPSTPSNTRSKTSQGTTAPKRYRNVESPNFGTIEVGDSTQRRTIKPKPTDPTPSVTVSVGDSRSAQSAN